ncbi:leucine--tRNA ligase [Candidatus Peregrinibacteria bacterium]|nr:leucine--tRNA ligase [Candidatus Peregrinibacteria bacterium]
MRYEPRKTEQKWQKIWEENCLYETDLNDEREKFYCLVMFPYPSGDKLHIGHWYNFAPTDSFARYMRMKGMNVLEPMGFDSFGLPAENYAISHGMHPKKSIAHNVATMERQLKEMGSMYDWSKEVITCVPEYYKWTQWMFLQLYKKGLAYRKNAPVNWCPSCQTVLANEQVQDGTCDRCHSAVTKKDLTQWFFNIKKYAERLLNFDGMDWPEKTKLMQEYWIGKSDGAEIDFELVPDKDNEIRGTGEKITVFTTRIDTLFGCTYAVLAPEHELVAKISTKKRLQEVNEYVASTRRKNDIERSSEEREKTGVFTGGYVINPVNGEKVPVWVADYVLASYGTGAVMAVPAHDTRDYAFAKKYKLPIRSVIKPRVGMVKEGEAFVEYGLLENSGDFSDLTSEEARVEITKKLEGEGKGRTTISYKLRDWLISRQRYWGAPIPIVYCKKCGEAAVSEKDLPVVLPDEVDFEPKGDGKSPLASSEEFVNTKCPKCKGPATREVDTMDTFMCSSWYFLRYIDSKNGEKPFDKNMAKKWLPVDMYVGGPEHACMHLLYARFLTKVLYDAKIIHFDEPFTRLVHQGMITKDGSKMSKSKGNVVSPDSFVEKYGSDVFRMYLMFMGPFTDGGDWNDRGITGIARFADRVWTLMLDKHAEKDTEALLRELHGAIKKVGEQIEVFHFNTAISAMMELTNLAYKDGMSLKSKKLFAQILAPFAPHLAEEIWQELNKDAQQGLGGNPVAEPRLGLKEEFAGTFNSIFNTEWPKYNKKYLQAATFELVVQVNGKVRGRIQAEMGISKEEAIELALTQPNIAVFIKDKKRLKEIFVPDRLLNIVVAV